jgi:uncharacterized damage-inducible protein DinB
MSTSLSLSELIEYTDCEGSAAGGMTGFDSAVAAF